MITFRKKMFQLMSDKTLIGIHLASRAFKVADDKTPEHAYNKQNDIFHWCGRQYSYRCELAFKH